TSPRTHGGIRSAASAGTGRPVPESRRRNSRPPGGGKWAGSVARSNVLAPIVQRPRTSPFQGGNTGSNPVGGAHLAPRIGLVFSAERVANPDRLTSNVRVGVALVRISTRVSWQVPISIRG